MPAVNAGLEGLLLARGRSGAVPKLDFVVILVVVAMAEVFRRTQGPAVGGVANLNPAIHVLQFNPRAAAAQFAAQIVADESVMIHVQAEVILDAAGNRAGLDFRFGV